MDVAFPVAEAVAATRFQALPAATARSAKRLILDSLAVALAGARSRDCTVLTDFARAWGGSPESTIIGLDVRVPAPVAALVNGTMIQALDFDDTHDASGAHTASTVLAAALAVAERAHQPGTRLIAALVAGVELACRLGLACHDKIGWTSTSVYGAFGAAAAAAHALGLDAAGTRHALGIVLSQAAGTTQTAVDVPLSKHMQSGFAAKAGVLSALLAAQGVTGVENVFEGPFGFFQLYKGGRAQPTRLVADWGRRYEIDGLSLKPYPCCRATHAAIDAALTLAAEAGLRPTDIGRVEVVIPQTAFELVGKPAAAGDNPVVAAQFSIQYVVASALARGRVSVRHFTPETVRDPVVQDLMQRVHVAVGGGDAFTPARLELHALDGRRWARTVHTLKGSPERPLGPDELHEKISDCLAVAEGPRGVTSSELIRVVDALDTMADVSGLLQALTEPPTTTRQRDPHVSGTPRGERTSPT